jgi:urease beta subunit
VKRCLRDAVVPGLSADTRFVMAYNAARTLSLMIVRAAGYRPRSVGAHCHTFAALETAADPAFAAISVYR